MNHADIKKHLADYLEGELPIEERALVDAHLDSCPICTGEVDEMLRTIHLLRTLPEPETPPMIAANVMRRIRSGEAQLGFFGRIGRVLGAVFEPGFVLPASAIAAAALVVAVFQGFGDFPSLDLGGEGGLAAEGGANSSVASMTSRLAQPRRGVSNASSAMDFEARVERRANQSGRALRSGVAQPMHISINRKAGESGTRIRIRLDGLTLARQPMSRPPFSSGGSLVPPPVPMLWAPADADAMSGDFANQVSPGLLVAAEGFAPPTLMGGSELWPRGAIESGTDPRDAWLALGFEDPAEFARYIAGQNLAEQELWAARLAERAKRRGLLDDFLQRLRESGDPTAVWVADDFAAQAERADRDLDEAKGQSTR